MVRPCAPHRYSPPHSSCCLEFSLPPTTAGRYCATGHPQSRGDRFPRFAREPRPRSRHLHAGHHLANTQAPARLIPGKQRDPGFDVTHTLTTLHQWFTRVRLRDPYLTRSNGMPFPTTLTTTALDRSSSGWFAAFSCKTATEGHRTNNRPAPPSLMQHRIRRFVLHRSSFCVRGAPSSAWLVSGGTPRR